MYCGAIPGVSQLRSSIDIKMKAPDSAQTSKYPYAKNNSWYSVDQFKVNDSEPNQYVFEKNVSNSESLHTIVTIGEKMQLIVRKELGSSVPKELKEELFTFRINAYVGRYMDKEDLSEEEGMTQKEKDLRIKITEEPFANVPYKLFEGNSITQSEYNDLSSEDKKNCEQMANDTYIQWNEIESTIPHTTNVNGELQLKDKQKAVFTYISSVNYGNNSNLCLW